MRAVLSAIWVIMGLCATALSAQEVITTPLEEIGEITPLDDLIGELIAIEPEDPENVAGPSVPTQEPVIAVLEGVGGQLRVLDKLTGAVTDLDLISGQTAQLGFLTVTLRACRYPLDNPSGDAFAFVDVSNTREQERLFQGWMLASAPALNAMDHPRYDVWALRCKTE